MSKRGALAAALCAGALLIAGCGAHTELTAVATPHGSVATVSAAPSIQAARQLTSPTPTSTPTPTPTPTPKSRPKPNPCAHNSPGQLVRVSLRQQHLWMCAGTHLVYSTPITSGIVGQYTSTPTGDYAVQSLDRNTVLTLITGQQYTVHYWIPFDAPLFGFHDSSWQDFPYGSAKYKTQGSHGCVHMPLKAIAFFYRWAQVGAKVTIRA